MKKYSSSNLTLTGLEEFEKTLVDPTQVELYKTIILPNISHDPLSHVLNKRYFLEKFLNEYQRAKNQNYPDGFAFILVGINEFDIISKMEDNTEEAVLSKTGKLLKKSFRNKDIIGRFSEYCFSILLVEVYQEIAIRRAKDLIFLYSKEEMDGLYFSISTGMAYFDGDNYTRPFQIIEKAEEKLNKSIHRAGSNEPVY